MLFITSNKIIVILVVNLIAIIVLVSQDTYADSCSPEKFMSSKLQVRPQIKTFIDQLKSFDVVVVGHTTDSISLNSRGTINVGMPQPPKPFPAGLYKVIFEKGREKRAIMVQTESKLSHYATIVPGKTDVDGYVQLFDDPQEEVPRGQKLNREEIDYLTKLIYSSFCNALTNYEYMRVNKLKDMLLAILFSSKPGIEEYHNNLLKVGLW